MRHGAGAELPGAEQHNGAHAGGCASDQRAPGDVSAADGGTRWAAVARCDRAEEAEAKRGGTEEAPLGWVGGEIGGASPVAAREARAVASRAPAASGLRRAAPKNSRGVAAEKSAVARAIRTRRPKVRSYDCPEAEIACLAGSPQARPNDCDPPTDIHPCAVSANSRLRQLVTSCPRSPNNSPDRARTIGRTDRRGPCLTRRPLHSRQGVHLQGRLSQTPINLRPEPALSAATSS